MQKNSVHSADAVRNSIFEWADAVAEWQADVISRLRKSLEAGNDAEALSLARELTGLNEKRTGTDSRQH